MASKCTKIVIGRGSTERDLSASATAGLLVLTVMLHVTRSFDVSNGGRGLETGKWVIMEGLRDPEKLSVRRPCRLSAALHIRTGQGKVGADKKLITT